MVTTELFNEPTNQEIEGDSNSSVQLNGSEPSERTVPWADVSVEVDEEVPYQGSPIDFECSKVPLQAVDQLGEIDVPHNYAIVRNDTRDVLGVAGERYEIASNKSLVELGQVLMESTGAKFDRAGVLGNGRKSFLTMTLPNQLDVPGGRISQNLLLMNSFDGRLSFRVASTPVNLRCHNAVFIALQQADQTISIRHTDSINERVDELKEELGQKIGGYFNELESVIEDWSQASLSEREFSDIAETLYPGNDEERSTRSQKKLDNLKRLFNDGTGVSDVAETKLAGLRALTEHVSHYRKTRGSERYSQEENHFRSLLNGTNSKLLSRGYRLLKAA
jgi:phage/plasmid-like protein (TIGR03299 family)